MLHGLPKIVRYVHILHCYLPDYTYFILKIELAPRLELVTAGHINYPVLVSARLGNQTSFCAASVRQRGRQMASSRVIAEQPDGEESPAEFRQRVVQYLAATLSTESPHGLTSGVTRQVRHTGVANERSGASGARKSDKAVARKVRAKVSYHLPSIDLLLLLTPGLHLSGLS